MPRPHAPFCNDPDCPSCEDRAEQLAEMAAEERAEDEMRAMEDRYEHEVLGL